MASEMMEALMALCQEKHIDELYLIDRLEQSLAKSYAEILHLDFGARVTIDRATGRVYVYKLVPEGDINDETGEFDNFEEVDVTPKDASRIAAQHAKSEIAEIVRNSARQQIFEEFSQRVGDIITGTVLQTTPDFAFIKIREGVEAELPYFDQRRYPDERNLVASEEDGAGGRTLYDHDAAGDLVGVHYADGTSESFSWDAEHRLVAAVDPAGAETRFSYDAAGDLVGIVDARGGETRLAWDADHRVTGVADPLGNGASFAYDVRGNRTSAVDPLGRETRYSYDAAGRLTGAVDALGRTASFAYTPAGKLVSMRNPAGAESTRTVDAEGLAASCRAWGGAEASFTYDAQGGVASATDALGNVSRFSWDASGNLVSATDALGAETRYSWDACGRLASVTDAAGFTRTRSYDAAGNLVSETDALGNATRYEYDAAGNLVSATDPAGNVERYERDAAGRLVRATDALGAETRYAWDEVGRLASVVDALGGETRYAYDANRNLVSATDPLGNATRYEHDAAGRLVRLTAPDGGETRYSWDAAGRLAGRTDANGNAESYVRDALGSIVEAVDAAGNSSAFAYDARGGLVRESLHRVDARDGVDERDETLYVRDARGLLESRTDPLGNETSYRWDGNGALASVVDAEGRRSERAYDARGLLASLDYGQGMSASFSWDAAGRLAGVSDWTGETSFSRDALGRIVAVATPSGRSVGYAWDALGRRAETVYPDGARASFSYDACGRTVSVGLPGGGTASYSYDAAGRLASAATPDGWAEEHSYDPCGRLAGTARTDAAGARSEASYSYDGCGNLLSAEEAGWGPQGAALSAEYSYDALNRLVSESRDGVETSWAYDSLGNLTSERVVGGRSVDYRHDAAGRLVHVSDDGSGTAADLSWDRAGNLVSVESPLALVGGAPRASAERFYGPDGRLAAARSAGGEAPYLWDALGHPVGRGDLELVPDYAAGPGAAPLVSYGPGGEPTRACALPALAHDLSGAPGGLTVHADRLGSARLAAFRDGSVAGEASYGPWGEALSASGALAPGGAAGPAFAGCPFDAASGAYLAAERLYDAPWRSFASPDPEPGRPSAPASLARYPYAFSNPTSLVDPGGRFPALAGAVWSTASAVYRFAPPEARALVASAVGRGISSVASAVGRGLSSAVSLWEDASAWASGYFLGATGSCGRRHAGLLESLASPHTALDAAGFVPVLGALADGGNAVWYASEGDWESAAWSLASAVPGLGDAGGAGKAGLKVGRAGARAGRAADAALAASRAGRGDGFERWLNRGPADVKVYFGVDDSGDVIYVGITRQDLDKRLAQHRRAGKPFKDLEMQHDGLTRNQAKALEQYYIDGHGGARAHGGTALLNIIDSIGGRNKRRGPALEWAGAHARGGS